MNSLKQNKPVSQVRTALTSGFFCPKVMVQDYILKTHRLGKQVEIRFNGYILFPTNDTL